MGKQSTNNNPPAKKNLIHHIKTEAATAAEDATEYMYTAFLTDVQYLQLYSTYVQYGLSQKPCGVFRCICSKQGNTRVLGVCRD